MKPDGALGTTLKNLERKLDELKTNGIIETISTTAVLKSVRTLRRSPEDLKRLAVTQTQVEILDLNEEEVKD